MGSRKIAFCILCHKFTPVLESFIKWMSEENDFYIHVDAKTDITPFEPLSKLDNVFFVPDRILVYWGTFSLVEATLKLFDMTNGKTYSHICLVSGDTLPLRSNREIKDYFSSQPETEFTIYQPVKPQHYDRIKYIYPDEDPKGKISELKLLWRRIQTRFKLYRKNRLASQIPPLAFGAEWIAFTPAFRDYLFDYLKDHPSYSSAFKRSRFCDEIFFHTIMHNSSFEPRNDVRHIMYDDWETGPQAPRILDETDFGRLQELVNRDDDTHHYLFARKFPDNLNLEQYEKLFLGDKRGEKP